MANDIATLEELRKRSGLDLADDTPAGDAAQIILDGLAGALQARGPLAETVVTDESHINHRGGDLQLRLTPVKTVNELRTVAAFSGTTTVVDSTSYVVQSWGIADAPSAAHLQVDYVAGPSAGVAAAAKHVLLEAATRVVKRMDGDDDGLESIRQEGYAVTFITEAFTESELALLPSRKKIR